MAMSKQKIEDIRSRYGVASKDRLHEFIAALLASHDELQAALTPFAEFCDALKGNNLSVPRQDVPDDTPIYGFNMVLLTMGDFRLARAAIKSEPTQ